MKIKAGIGKAIAGVYYKDMHPQFCPQEILKK